MKNLQGWMILGIACLAGCVGTTIPVQAQQTATAIVVKERLVEHVGDRLIIDMKLALDELSLSANRSLVCTPLIERGDSVRALPPVIVNGRNRQIQYDRSGRDATANGEFVLRRHNGKEQTFDYHASIPFAKWMERSEVSLVADFCGCGWEALSNDKSPLFPIRIAEPVVLRPLLAYVTPEAERVKERVKEGSAFLDFPVNRTEIYPEYKHYLPWGPFYGVFVKKGTPKDVVAKLTDAFTKAYNEARFTEFVANSGGFKMGLTGQKAADFTKKFESTASWLIYNAGGAKKSPKDFNIPQPK